VQCAHYMAKKPGFVSKTLSCNMDFTHSILHNLIIGPWLGKPRPIKLSSAYTKGMN